MPPVAARSPGYRLAAAGLSAPAPPPSSSSSSAAPLSSTTSDHSHHHHRRSHVSALGISSPSSADAPSHDSREDDAFLPKRHGGGGGGGGGDDVDDDEGEAEEGLFLRRRKGRRSALLFSSASSSPGSLPQKKKQGRHGPPTPTPPTLLSRRSRRCSSRLARLCALALLALAATLALCAVAELGGAALFARAPGVSADARFWDRWESALLRKAAGGGGGGAGPLTVALERHWLEAKGELVSRRWRTVVAAAAGSLRNGGGSSGGESGVGEKSAPSSSSSSSLLAFPPTLPAFLSSSCSDLLSDYAPLISADLEPWPRVTRAMIESDPDRLYFVGGRAFLPKNATRGRLMPTFHAFLQRLSLRVALPDLVIPLNVADEPRAPWEAGREWGGEHAGGDEAALLRSGGGGAAAAAAAAAAAGKKRSSGKQAGDSSNDERGNSSGSSWWTSPLLKKKSKEAGSGDGNSAGAAATATTASATAESSRHRSSSSSSPAPPPYPLFSFCKTRDYADILLPNTIEGDVFVRPRDGKKKKRKNPSSLPPLDVADAVPEEEALRRLLLPRVVSTATSVTTHRKVRAGPSDPRPARAVWRGSTGGFGGLAKGRAALLELGRTRPDLLDSGVYDWDEGKWGPPEGRVKARMGLADQVDGYKCVLFCF